MLYRDVFSGRLNPQVPGYLVSQAKKGFYERKICTWGSDHNFIRHSLPGLPLSA